MFRRNIPLAFVAAALSLLSGLAPRLSFASLPPNPEVAAHPDAAKLRLFRTYHHVELLTRTAEQFEVWYQTSASENEPRQWEIFRAAANPGDDTSLLTPDQYMPVMKAFAGYPQPRDDFEKVPTELKSLEDGLIRAVKRNHADQGIGEVRVRYLGRSARIQVGELTPVGPIGASLPSMPLGMAIKSNRTLLADLEHGTITPDDSLGTSVGKLEIEDADRQPIQGQPNWVDFVLPREIEGSSLFALDVRRFLKQPIPAAYEEARAALDRAILSTVRELERGPLADPTIERVLDQQDRSVLPPGLHQHLKFSVSIYGRTPDPNEPLRQRLEFLLPVSDQPFSVTRADAASGLTISVRGHLGDQPEITVQARDLDGNGSEKKLTLSRDPRTSVYYGFIRDGSTQAMAGMLYLDAEDDGLIQLPGHGEYMSFRITPDLRVMSSFLTGDAQLE